MYLNLKAEISRKNMTVKALAQLLGMRYCTLTGKINGKAPFTIDEAFRICEVFEGCTIEYLFKKE